MKNLFRKNIATETSDKHSPEAYVNDAIRHNCAKRERLVAESTAIVIAAWRRDNFTHMKLTRSELHASVMKRVKNEAYMIIPSLEQAPDSGRSTGSVAGFS